MRLVLQMIMLAVTAVSISVCQETAKADETNSFRTGHLRQKQLDGRPINLKPTTKDELDHNSGASEIIATGKVLSRQLQPPVGNLVLQGTALPLTPSSAHGGFRHGSVNSNQFGIGHTSSTAQTGSVSPVSSNQFGTGIISPTSQTSNTFVSNNNQFGTGQVSPTTLTGNTFPIGSNQFGTRQVSTRTQIGNTLSVRNNQFGTRQVLPAGQPGNTLLVRNNQFGTGQVQSGTQTGNSFSVNRNPFGTRRVSPPFQTGNISPQQTSPLVPVTPAIPIVYEERNGPDASGSYSFAYESADGTRRQETGQRKGPETIAVQGSYSYISPEGIPIEVRYVADEFGFRAEGDHIPTPPPAPLHSLLQIQAAEEARAREREQQLTGNPPTIPGIQIQPSVIPQNTGFQQNTVGVQTSFPGTNQQRNPVFQHNAGGFQTNTGNVNQQTLTTQGNTGFQSVFSGNNQQNRGFQQSSVGFQSNVGGSNQAGVTSQHNTGFQQTSVGFQSNVGGSNQAGLTSHHNTGFQNTGNVHRPFTSNFDDQTVVQSHVGFESRRLPPAQFGARLQN